MFSIALLVGRSRDRFPVMSLGIFVRGSPRRNHVPWGRLSLWKWVPGISAGVKTAGAYGWRPTTLVVLNVKKICGLKSTRNPLGHLGLLWDYLYLTHVFTFLVNEIKRRTEFQFYWYYDSTCFGQPFCPSSGVLSRTSALVDFCRFDDRCCQEQDWIAVVPPDGTMCPEVGSASESEYQGFLLG